VHGITRHQTPPQQIEQKVEELKNMFVKKDKETELREWEERLIAKEKELNRREEELRKWEERLKK